MACSATLYLKEGNLRNFSRLQRAPAVAAESRARREEARYGLPVRSSGKLRHSLVGDGGPLLLAPRHGQRIPAASFLQLEHVNLARPVRRPVVAAIVRAELPHQPQRPTSAPERRCCAPLCRRRSAPRPCGCPSSGASSNADNPRSWSRRAQLAACPPSTRGAASYPSSAGRRPAPPPSG